MIPQDSNRHVPSSKTWARVLHVPICLGQIRLNKPKEFATTGSVRAFSRKMPGELPGRGRRAALPSWFDHNTPSFPNYYYLGD